LTVFIYFLFGTLIGEVPLKLLIMTPFATFLSEQANKPFPADRKKPRLLKSSLSGSKGETDKMALSTRAKKLVAEITNGNVKLGDLASASLPQIPFLTREPWSAPL
jgi:hypothetical protein